MEFLQSWATLSSGVFDSGLFAALARGLNQLDGLGDALGTLIGLTEKYGN